MKKQHKMNKQKLVELIKEGEHSFLEIENTSLKDSDSFTKNFYDYITTKSSMINAAWEVTIGLGCNLDTCFGECYSAITDVRDKVMETCEKSTNKIEDNSVGFFLYNEMSNLIYSQLQVTALAKEFTNQFQSFIKKYK